MNLNPFSQFAISLRRIPLLVSILSLGLTSSGLATQSALVTTDHVKSRLVSSAKSIQPGQPFDVALSFQIENHWHTYYKNPGDSGLATSLQWDLPGGFTASDIIWPDPERLPFGSLVNFGYQGSVLHVVTITPPDTLKPTQTVTLKARADWLVCEEICIPGSGSYTLSLPVAKTATPSPWADPIARVKNQVSHTLNGLTYSVSNQQLILRLPEEPRQVLPKGPLSLFPDQEGLINNQAMLERSPESNPPHFSIPLAENATLPEILTGRLISVENPEVSYTFQAPRDTRTDPEKDKITSPGFIFSLLLGFLGGLILNLMPCVFPVLGIKIMGFVRQSGEARTKVIAHGLSFTAGVLLSFWVLAGILLALRAGGQELGWGFQLQSSGFVFALMLFLFAFGLNLSGVFEFGTSAIALGARAGSGTAGSSSTGTLASFFSGVLATVVATPCAAPFLAPALGAALSLPAPASLLLFTSIGSGLSTPYLLLSLRPELIRFLPRPGAWMETFKQAMAFPLYATAAYLLWVLDGQVNATELLHILFSLAAVAGALWIYGRWSTPARTAQTRLICAITSTLLLLASLFLAWPRAESTADPSHVINWQPWSKQIEKQKLAEGHPVYVDFTARWCATCQTNKAVAFSDTDVINEFRNQHIVALRADWTRQDPEITRELARFHRSAVPFNVLYRPGRPEPHIFPELLTPGIVLDALHSSPPTGTRQP